ncbi:unnamed protein product [Penicillium camemberti]|uniref:Str. FM013 n=1 Tax=Penicillium camemberti (strain FM 013) TaxID=1429867 RepID=A0A0G4PWV6_PENC3|nr:unnamed protein product [Penicillium camemberti]
MPLQIVAVERRQEFNRPQLRELSLNAFCQAENLCNRRSREAYKYVLYLPAVCSTIDSLDSAKSSRIVSESLDRIRRGPASQTVSVKDIVLSRSTVPNSQPTKETKLRLAGPSVCDEISATVADWADCTASMGNSRESANFLVEDIQSQCTGARVTALCRLFVPSFGYQNIRPRGYIIPVSTLHKAIAYTLFLAPLVQPTQQKLPLVKDMNQGSGAVTGTDIRLRTSLHGSLRRPFFLVIRANFCAPNTNTITDFHAIVHRSSPSPPVRHPRERSHRRIAGKTRWHFDACSIASSSSPPSLLEWRSLWPSALRNIHPLRLFNCFCLVISSHPMPPETMRGAPQPGHGRRVR